MRHHNEELAENVRESLSEIAGFDLSAFLDAALSDAPNPDLALVNLERWLLATSNPSMQLERLAALPAFAHLLVTLLGAGQPIADSLVQNPELVDLIADTAELERVPTVENVLAEGRDLLAASTSYTHGLDRLRFLKQRRLLPIVVNDLARRWDAEAVWRALSDVADALTTLALELVWKEHATRKALPDRPCPIAVIAFGKLGGRELNYSSDVDLVYVCPDDLDESMEKHVSGVCETLNRALADRMGRGSLYRVDLRLRPFGGTGSLVAAMRSIEAYYRSHAEAWEIQALIRSRAILGPASLRKRWAAMRERTCFRQQLSDLALEEMLSMRARIEEAAQGDDLKRGPGGIRDVEFLVQTLQAVHGGHYTAARAPATCDALRALSTAGALSADAARDLAAGYRFLRQLEHRCQLVGDVQTHSVPKDEWARLNLARSIGYGTWEALEAELGRTRARIRALYDHMHAPSRRVVADRSVVAESLGPFGEEALRWFDSIPECQAYYFSLRENKSSLERARRILAHAPALIPHFKRSLSLTENLVSGEIEEEVDISARYAALPVEARPEALAETAHAVWLTIAAQWVLNPDFDVGLPVSANIDAVIDRLWRGTSAGPAIVALGSYGLRENAFGSDADLLFLVKSRARHAAAEECAQDLLATLDRLKRLGAPVSADLRLRPEGRQGLLVRTFDGFKSYELESMEMWERFAMGQARLLCGERAALELVTRSAYAAPLTPEALQDLLHMKKRIETERVPAQYSKRNVKLGYGGLSDIEWLVHLHEMRYPTATRAGTHFAMEDRLRALERAGLLNCLELEQLLTARRHLAAIRNRIFLFGFLQDTIPENPDKLDRLASAEGLENGNAFLARHTDMIEAVRSVYLPAMDRLIS